MKEWIKLESTFMMDSRIVTLIEEAGFCGLGIYLTIRTAIESISDFGLTMPQAIACCLPYARQKRIRKIIENYGLFNISESGLVTPCPLIFSCTHTSGNTSGHTSMHTPAHGLISDKEEENRKEDNNNNNDGEPLFIKPTISEIAEYCQQRNNGIDAGHFFDYYESKGWSMGKGKMMDWRSAVRTWERNNKEIVRRTTRTVHKVTEEYDDDSQVCYNCQPIPEDAPPRPSPNAQWDFATDSWSEFY